LTVNPEREPLSLANGSEVHRKRPLNFVRSSWPQQFLSARSCGPIENRQKREPISRACDLFLSVGLVEQSQGDSFRVTKPYMLLVPGDFSFWFNNFCVVAATVPSSPFPITRAFPNNPSPPFSIFKNNLYST
jgi:hypothetical protein